MPYVTLPQLAELPGALELAQVATDQHVAVVDAQLMELTLTAGDRSGYLPAEIAAADAAVVRIQQAITEADAIIDGYLARRYRLPLATVPGLVTSWSRVITRYKLHQDRRSGEGDDPIVRDYRDALRFLDQVALGKFSLGLDDPESSSDSPGDVMFDPGVKAFGRKFLP
jgi:phage gp36-like protein